MTLPINHLIRILDRCCVRWEFEYAGDDSFRIVFLNTGERYFAECTADGRWLVDSRDNNFLANRLNGLTRDDSGTMRTDAGEWEVIENPPPDMVIQEGDEYWSLMLREWLPCKMPVYKSLEVGKRIRRRRKPAQLPADFDCVPEASDEQLKKGDWVVCVDAGCSSGINVGDVLQVKDFDSCNDPGFDLPRGRSFYLTHRFRRARPDEIPQPVEQAQQLQLREGAWYRRRDGEVVGPARRSLGKVFTWIVADNGYIDNGCYNASMHKSARDLIAEVPAPSEPTAEPDADGWIEHDGRDCPVEIGKQVQVKRYDYSDVDTIKIDSCSHNTASDWHWMPATLGKFHITHYRLVQPAPQYRPFASADEFLPYCHELMECCISSMKKRSFLMASSFDDNGLWHAGKLISWFELMSQFVFVCNRKPCGVEVK